ncbi:alanine racemase [Candidatus Spyradosoma sp. SGI.093]|uniref:alanine racemase n=1 Tax=Candidatus Spyradosoma sp. SGI.093 TaxID=3420583 RepID=UPI003D046327
MNAVSHLPRAWAEIDLPAFERNVGKIKASLPPHIRYIAVVKADGYGHGVGHIVERLLQCGIDAFAVANAREGADVRYVAPQSEIFILGPTLPEEAESAVADRLTVAVSDAEEARALSALAESRGTRVAVNLKIDTGMGRMGVWHENAAPLAELLAELPGVDFRGVFTHFSSADTSFEYTQLQRARFLAAVGKIPESIREKLTIHADNSAGLETFSRERPFNAVRVGILQYGLPPAPGTLFEKISPEPVLSFRSRVGLVKTLPAGTPVSYNRTKTLARETRVAIVTAGYGDGIPTAASNRASFLLHGRRVPVLGRVTMDQTLVDVSDVPEARVGDVVTLIGAADGASVSIEEFCAWGDCISWEALVSITKRVPRIYEGLRR